MCCGSPDWKREVVQDHKFDFIDVRDYHDSGCLSRLQYLWVYILVIKSFLVYVSDLYTAITMLASNHWAGSILQNAGDSTAAKVPFSIGKWIFTGCIIFSFLLLAWEARKGRAIIRSRDISYAFTNVMANNYYSMKSYDHFCFFSQINNSKKKKDEFAFFIFFTFKGWKRLLLADAPRQVINGLTLYSFGKANNFTTDVSKYYEGSFVKAGVLVTMLFTVTIFIGSAILLAVAAIMYVPLLCYIQGNLKEYCCHKVDKRISELVKRKMRKRLAHEAAIAKKEAAGDYSHLKDKKGKINRPLPQQPTLPTVDLSPNVDYIDSKSDIGSAVHMYPPGGGGYATARGLQYPQQPWAGNGYYEKSGGYGGYAASDVGSIRGGVEGRDRDRPAYEGSISSLEPLTARPGPAGGYHGHSHTESVHSADPHAYGSGGIGRAPTYRSQEGAYSSTSLPVYEAGNAPPMPENAQWNAYQAQQAQYGYGAGQGGSDVGMGYGQGDEMGYGGHQQNGTSSQGHGPVGTAAGAGPEYQAPGQATKNTLLERTAGGKTLSVADSVSELGYWREDQDPTGAAANQSLGHSQSQRYPNGSGHAAAYDYGGRDEYDGQDRGAGRGGYGDAAGYAGNGYANGYGHDPRTGGGYDQGGGGGGYHGGWAR